MTLLDEIRTELQAIRLRVDRLDKLCKDAENKSPDELTDPYVIIRLCSEVLNVPFDQIISVRRFGYLAWARMCIGAILYERGFRPCDIARIMRHEYSSVRYWCKKVRNHCETDKHCAAQYAQLRALFNGKEPTT